jgi:hypothetical protein
MVLMYVMSLICGLVAVPPVLLRIWQNVHNCSESMDDVWKAYEAGMSCLF